MSINPLDQFHQKLESALDNINTNEESLLKFNRLKKCCEDLYLKSMSEDDKLYYKETLSFISSTLAALQMDVFKNIKKAKISEINNVIIALADQSVKVIVSISQTFSDPDIAPYVDKKLYQPETIPYRELYVAPALNLLEGTQKSLEDMFSNPDYVESHNSKELKEHLIQFMDQSNNFVKVITRDRWVKCGQMEQPAIDASSEVDHNIAFTEVAVPGDGDCGFHATGIRRKETVDYLLLNSENRHVRELVAPEILGWLITNGESPIDKGDPQGKIDQSKKKILDAIETQVRIRPFLELSGSTDVEILLDWENKKNRLDCGRLGLLTDVSIDPADLAILKTLYDQQNDLRKKVSNDEGTFRRYVNEYYKSGGYLVLPDPGTTGVMNVMAEWKKTPIQVWKVDPEDPSKLYLRYQTEITEENKNQIKPIIHRGLHYNALRSIADFDPSTAQEGDSQNFAGIRYGHRGDSSGVKG